MPVATNRALFLTGLALVILAMTGIFAFGATSKVDSAVDGFHWLMLTGAVMQLPYAVDRRDGWLNSSTALVMLVGLVCTIGMCMIDFVLWAMPTDSLRETVAAELIATPSIWPVFMDYGPEEILYTGYALACLSPSPKTKSGPALVIVGAILAIVGGTWFNVAGAACVLSGFAITFRAQARQARNTAPA